MSLLNCSALSLRHACAKPAYARALALTRPVRNVSSRAPPAGVGRNHEQVGGFRHDDELFADLRHRLGGGLVVRLVGLLGADRGHAGGDVVLELQQVAQEIGAVRGHQ
jgi:hypothetical protein